MAMRMAVKPAHRLRSVKRLGTSMRTGTLFCRNSSRRRRRRSSFSSLGNSGSMRSTQPFALLPARLALRFLGAQVGHYRLAADGALADRDQGALPGRHIQVDPRSEADQAEPLADADAVALVDEGDDAARDQAGDLHHGDL